MDYTCRVCHEQLATFLIDRQEVCAKCQHSPTLSSPPPIEGNILCASSYGEDNQVRACAESAEFFCLCGTRPLYLCEAHANAHLQKPIQVPHLLSRMEEHEGIEVLGVENFKRNQLSKVAVTDVLTQECARIDSKLGSLNSSLSELQVRMHELQAYINDLTTKTSDLQGLKDDLQHDPYTLSVDQRLQTFFEQHAVGDRPVQSFRDYIGQFLTYEHEEAVRALQLRPEVELIPGYVTGLNMVMELVASPDELIQKDSSMCFLDKNTLFACGGTSNTACLVTPADGKVRVADMQKVRRNHGIIHYGDSVYVFGGIWKRCSGVGFWERFHIASKTWESIGKMMARSFFNPCAVGSVIYIAGGLTEDSDIIAFSPENERFSPLRLTREGEIRVGGIAMNFKETLVVLVEKKIMQIDLAKKTVTTNRIPETFSGVQWQSLVAPLYDDQNSIYVLVSKSLAPLRTGLVPKEELIKVRVSLTPSQEIALETFP